MRHVRMVWLLNTISETLTPVIRNSAEHLALLKELKSEAGGAVPVYEEVIVS